MTVQRIDTAHEVRQLDAAILLLQATHGEEVVQGTARDAAIGKPLRVLERVANLCDQVSSELRDQMLQLRDGWESV